MSHEVRNVLACVSAATKRTVTCNIEIKRERADDFCEYLLNTETKAAREKVDVVDKKEKKQQIKVVKFKLYLNEGENVI